MAELEFTGFIFNILVIAISFVVLNWASNTAINNAIKVAKITQLGKTAIGFSLIAFSTSLPELTVAIIAAFSGGASLSVGNVLGSNIINICVIMGIATLLLYLRFYRRKKMNYSVTQETSGSEINDVQGFAKSELNNINFGLFISSIIPMVLIYINSATWIVGLVLISIFVVYIYQLSKIRMPQEGEEATEEEKRKIKKIVALTIVSVLGVVLSAYFLVESAVGIAETIGIPQTIIGATIIALGTSLPELTLDLKSFLRGHSGLALGDIIGSSFVNITLILGVTLFVPALLGSPMTMNMDVFQNLIVFSIIANLLFWYFLSREKIGWKEGVVFLFVYALFLASTLGFL